MAVLGVQRRQEEFELLGFGVFRPTFSSPETRELHGSGNFSGGSLIRPAPSVLSFQFSGVSIPKIACKATAALFLSLRYLKPYYQRRLLLIKPCSFRGMGRLWQVPGHPPLPARSPPKGINLAGLVRVCPADEAAQEQNK